METVLKLSPSPLHIHLSTEKRALRGIENAVRYERDLFFVVKISGAIGTQTFRYG